MKVLLALPGTQHAPVLANELARPGMYANRRICFGLPERGFLPNKQPACPRLHAARMSRNRIVSDVRDRRLRAGP
jgi:hypothetical protein